MKTVVRSWQELWDTNLPRNNMLLVSAAFCCKCHDQYTLDWHDVSHGTICFSLIPVRVDSEVKYSQLRPKGTLAVCIKLTPPVACILSPTSRIFYIVGYTSMRI